MAAVGNIYEKNLSLSYILDITETIECSYLNNVTVTDSQIMKNCKNQLLDKSLRNWTYPTNRGQIFCIDPLSYFAEIDEDG